MRNSSKKIENYLNNNYERLELQNNKFGKGFAKFYNEVYKLINSKSYNKKILSFNIDALKSFKNLLNLNKKMKVYYND